MRLRGHSLSHGLALVVLEFGSFPLDKEDKE